MGAYDQVLDVHAKYTSARKQNKIDLKATEDRLLNYALRVFDNPKLSPILNKKKGA
jgi:hypothetical protein